MSSFSSFVPIIGRESTALSELLFVLVFFVLFAFESSSIVSDDAVSFSAFLLGEEFLLSTFLLGDELFARRCARLLAGDIGFCFFGGFSCLGDPDELEDDLRSFKSAKMHRILYDYDRQGINHN